MLWRISGSLPAKYLRKFAANNTHWSGYWQNDEYRFAKDPTIDSVCHQVGQLPIFGYFKNKNIPCFRCCIALRSGVPCLMLRLCTYWDEPLVGADVHVMVIFFKKINENFHFEPLNISSQYGGRRTDLSISKR